MASQNGSAKPVKANLEAIKYERGRLRLLEQRRLPQHTEWVDVAGVRDGWAAIRDMTVRGAPAIAIAAALSLAVELTAGGGGAQYADAAAAAAAVAAHCDFLDTSRPTAVNLFEATAKLRGVAAAAAAAPGAAPAAVVAAVVAAAEAMLAADVAANRAIGRHGADAVLAAAAAAAAARGAPPPARIAVLTHCNAGALATAGYGTALGVVRALAERGALAHAYCTETRPYNQGARLTAYELAAEGLPATLVCDSAGAALLASGRVHAVVVGADRVAANGDAANKVGTFALAAAAAHAGVPFFVAAPTTTLDAALPGGADIPIEERPAEEVTHFRGERVAAEGVAVWNPAFDVTPAALIAGVVTEAGLVPRSAAPDFAPGAANAAAAAGGMAHDVRGWLAALAAGAAANGAAAAAGAKPPALATPPGFRALDEAGVRAYVAARPELAPLVGPLGSAPAWRVREVGDGNINFVYVVEGPAGAVCVKQALPYVRCVGEGWPLGQARVAAEAAALAAHAALCPAHVPRLFVHDAAMCLLAMEYLGPPRAILRGRLVEGAVFPRLAAQAGELLAATLFGTSPLALGGAAFRALAERFGSNGEMCALTEQVVFTDPFFAAPHNRHTPALAAAAAALRADAGAKAAAAALKARFLGCRQALLHGDLHTGSLMVCAGSCAAIDPEFAFVGPMGFDVGKLVANLLLAFLAADGHEAAGGGPRAAQRAWLLDAAAATWEEFDARLRARWDAAAAAGAGGAACAPELFGGAADGGGAARRAAQRRFLGEVWADAVGFAGAVMVRRVVGIAHVADFEAIADEAARAACEARALRLGRRLMVEGVAAAPDARALAALADAERADGAQPYFAL